MRVFAIVLQMMIFASCSNSEVEWRGDVNPSLHVDYFADLEQVEEQVQSEYLPQRADKATQERRKNLPKLSDLFLFRGNFKAVSGSLSVEDLPGRIDLSMYDTPVEVQEGPLCTAWAYVAALENQLCHDKPDICDKFDIELDEKKHFSKYRKYSLYAAMVAGDKWRLNFEGSNAEHTKISGYSYLGNNVAELQQHLASGRVATLATRVPKSMTACDYAINENSGWEEGGHALEIAGLAYQNGQYLLLLKNSWGTNCGRNGYQWFPTSLCYKSGGYCEFYGIDGVDTTLSVTPSPAPKKCKWWQFWCKR